MFVNSLFCDFLKENGLKIWKGESTRDLICLEFNFGSRSYKKELEHLASTAYSARNEFNVAKIRNDSYLMDKKYTKRKKIMELLDTAHASKHNYEAHTKEEIRHIFYNNGVTVEYITRDKNGNIKKSEKLHYKMLYRSTGKAKKGSCMFIVDRLYKKAINFLYMGIKLPKENPMLVEISAYAPLSSSAIVDKIKINPKNILILKDVDRFFKTNVVSIETDADRHCVAKKIDNYELKNTLFDGQALIDSSIFPDWGNGYILLRHHFCKMAAFCSNIQKFFQDYFGDDYCYATVKDMFGNEHYVKDIELITTDNAVKWLKFGISYDYWCDWVYKNNCMFGIVKTAHESKLGDVQKMSYQMVNSLDESSMNNVVSDTLDYLYKLKQDDDAFLEYLEKNANFANDFDVLVALCNHNNEFVRSSYFRERKKKIIETYVLNIKTGKIIQNAENLVIVGSPYAMLLYGATGDSGILDKDDTFFVESNTIQCFTSRFPDNSYLAGFRSPFNGRNNMIYMHNMYSDKMIKYFNFGNLIIAVNMIGTDFQDRANGADQDSDSLYTTAQSDIVLHAEFCYKNYLTIVNNIPKEKNNYQNTLSDYANIDNNLANSQLSIGESSNLAQIALTYSYNFADSKYDDYVCVLSVAAQIAIDNAKRRFDVDLNDEIRRIKDDMNIKENGYPKFWSIIKKNFKGKINESLHCPMNCLYDLDISRYRNSNSTLSMDNFFEKHPLLIERRTCRKVEELIEKYAILQNAINSQFGDSDTKIENYLLLQSDFDDLLSDMGKINISCNYVGLMSWLIDRAFTITSDAKRHRNESKSLLSKNRVALFKTLYSVNKSCFLRCFTSGK